MADDENQTMDGYEPSSAEERARKQARVRGMTDPLGSMGFRETPQRYKREARARRGVFGGAAASFVIGTALIIAANERTAESTPAGTEAAAPTGQVVSTQGAVDPQPATSNISQPTGNASGQAETGAPANGLSGSESTELLVQSRPEQQITNSDDDDRYDDDDHDDDDDDDDERYEDDDHDDDDDESSSGFQGQGNQSSSTSSTSGSQTEIVIPSLQPHTQTSSTRD